VTSVGEPVRVLISAAGRRGALLGLFRAALAELGLHGELLAADLTPLAAAFHLADRAFVVPAAADAAFVPAMLELCARERVALVVPTNDHELPVYAASREAFAAIGTTVAISTPDVVAIGRDKLRTNAWCREHGLPTVRQATPAAVLADPGAWRFPLIAKPARGSAAIGVERVADVEELRREAGEGYVVEETAPGVEHTIDLLVLDGRLRSAVPRKRLEVRAGEVQKAVTVRRGDLDDLARRVAEALPGAFGALNVQAFLDETSGALSVIELNPRFGGGFPLAHAAGASFPRWLLEHVLALPSTAHAGFRDGLVMLRYDEAVFVSAAAAGLRVAGSA
jgi:carbamoyl-phosphate synthase large subunit